MTLIQAIILGALQGLTEFFPVSSSGHLVIFPELMGGESPPLMFNVLVHFGTLVAAAIYFRRDVWETLRGLGRVLAKPRDAKTLWRDDPWARLALLLAAGTVPTGAGLLSTNSASCSGMRRSLMRATASKSPRRQAP